MSLQSLYTISEFNVKGNEFSAIITFDPSHEIFSGHFPEQPIVPGVCLIHIIKDIAIRIAEHEVVLSNGSNIKFLSVIDPRKHA
ncbi:MAG: 3-hydroxylacyl-ACP dehydratase, partial [Bacteroidales bacterium]|nr:3-hydroxylacyl-ACP dehydratase [Bacteroidales bacterium]